VSVIFYPKVETGVAGIAPFRLSRYNKGGLEKSGVNMFPHDYWNGDFLGDDAHRWRKHFEHLYCKWPLLQQLTCDEGRCVMEVVVRLRCQHWSLN
jgi:hypothetical protein